MKIAPILDRERQQLLDIGTRNRLISTPRKQKRRKQIEIIHERSAQLFDILANQKRRMTFLPLGTDDDQDESEVGSRQAMLLSLMAAEASETTSSHHTDTNLQTDLAPKVLQKRLRDFFNDSRTFVEEQGVNPLFLALGFVRWRETGSSDRDRYAPLILLPAELERHSVSSQFRLTATGDDLSTNLSFQQKLKSDFDLTLPELPAEEDLNVGEYFDQVAAAIQKMPEWEVLADDMQLNFFQFAKFLMYRDLDAQAWPDGQYIEENPLLQGLLGDGFEIPDPVIAPGERIDDRLSAQNMVHVVDADSSQMAAIEEVRCGRNLVIQGPPGTGKSQTITNLVATGVREGKKVLFLSEKMAALEVVKRRLESIGLGDMCLELHSNKSRKKEVLGELNRTLQLRQSDKATDHSVSSTVDKLKISLNRTVDAMHRPAFNSDLTPFDIVGRLVFLHSQHQFQEAERRAAFLQDPIRWTRDQVKELREQLSGFIKIASSIGPPKKHSFQGANCGVMLRSDMDSLRTDMERCRDAVQDLSDCTTALAKSLGVAAPRKKYRTQDIRRLCDIAEAIAKSPEMDPEAIQHNVWKNKLKELLEVVSAGNNYRKVYESLEGKLNEGAIDVSVAEARRYLNAYGRQFFLLRLFNGKYKAALNTLRELLTDAPPKSLADRLAILDSIIDCQKLKEFLTGDDKATAACQSAFGSHWKGLDSDWDLLQATADWVELGIKKKLHDQFRRIRGCLKTEPAKVADCLQMVDEGLVQLPSMVAGVRDRMQLESGHKFSGEHIEELPLPVVMKWLDRASSQLESLPDWVRYRLRRDDLAEGELRSIVRLIDNSAIECDRALVLFDLVYHEDLLRQLYLDRPELSSFSGSSHQLLRDRFCVADHQMIKTTRSEVSSFHRSRIPGGALGGMKVLRHEIQKKGRHKSIRRLLREAGQQVQEIKPVFMMSPLSIAQYLEPGAVEFDLLLIDEASQIEPVDALGAIARCRQVVVVGDDKQLPPTQFFSKSAEADEDDDADSARELESILALCLARGLPQRMLMWHYRSQHQSLISVSNSEYYDNRLFVVPSPVRDSPDYGVKFVFVENGIYERGGSTTNPVEAKVVAEHVVEHARKHPCLSLGVAAFSLKQRDAIQDELELLQRENPDVAPFFQKSGVDAYFTKNLERIQGDERDVIFISVGYGKDADGYMTQSYGPLNRSGGERRLNVLISRAKQKCTVFSSITADDIGLHRAKGKGVVGLKKYLQFAEHGYSDVGEITGRDHDSEFEREVAKAIAGYGHTVEAQVGVAGFFIDLAIVDPGRPGRYLLGIECDGASYHSSRSARDRDRLREEVLRARGWQIHRIWSADWYQQPKKELRKVLSAIELARKVKLQPPAHQKDPAPATLESPSADDEPTVDQVDVADDDQFFIPSPAVPGIEDHQHGIPVVSYKESTFKIPGTPPILEMAHDDLDKAILAVVNVEGPIHRDEIARRLTALSGTRAGRRIRQAVQAGVMRLDKLSRVKMDGEFVVAAGMNECVVRDRSNVASSSLKSPKNIPPQEIEQAMLQLIKLSSNAEADDLIHAVSAVMGFRKAGANFKRLAQSVIDGLIGAGQLIDRDGVVSLGNVEWSKVQDTGVP